MKISKKCKRFHFIEALKIKVNIILKRIFEKLLLTMAWIARLLSI